MAWNSTGEIPGFYGDDREEYRFIGPKPNGGMGEKYFTLVNKQTGEIELWNEEFGMDRRVGALKNGSWNFDETASGKSTQARDWEVEYFSKPENTKGVTNQALLTVERDKLTGSNLEQGETALNSNGQSTAANISQAQSESRNLLGTNQKSTSARTTELENAFSTIKEGAKANKNTRQNFGNHVYPKSLRQGRGGQDIIKFTMLEYKPRKYKTVQGSNLSGFEQGTRSGETLRDRKPLGSVVLPIPAGISDQNAVDWSEDTQNPVQAAAAGFAMKALFDSAGTGKALSAGADAVKKNMPEIKAALGTAIVSSAVGVGFDQMLARQSGAILNPNMELLFKKPMLRPFQFQFRLSPRSREEGQEIIRILRFFKQGMSPQRTEGRLFLKTPNTFRLQYLKDQRNPNPYLNRFKECALTSCVIDYTPDQNYATYEDGIMTQYSMTLQFKELEAVFSDDYEIDDGNQVSGNPQGALPATIGY